MASSPPLLFDVVVVGAGPAGVVAALRAARLGASTALITATSSGEWPRTTAPCRYADQNEQDYEEFVKAVRSARLEAVEGV